MWSGVGGDRGPSPPRECDLVLRGALLGAIPSPSASSTPRSYSTSLQGQQVRSASPHSFPNLRAGLSLVSTPSLRGLLGLSGQDLDFLEFAFGFST